MEGAWFWKAPIKSVLPQSVLIFIPKTTNCLHAWIVRVLNIPTEVEDSSDRSDL